MKYKIKITKGLTQNLAAKDIRRKVFMNEQGFKNEFDSLDDIAFHAVIYDDNNGIATARLYQDENGWHIGRVAVLPQYRRQKLGEEVMLALESHAKRQGISEITLSAQVQAVGFYEKLGYKKLNDLHMDEFCPHITMKKTL